jgi:NodT family efflux transporter outer membrane factor (OMF) lipoprotein
MRFVATTPIVVFILILTSGCAVGPDYHKPDLAAQGQFLGQRAINQRDGSSAVDLASWWQSFNDPTLTRIVKKAIDENLDIAQAVARVQQSKSALQSANAALLPSGEIGAQGIRVHQSLDTPQGRLLGATPNFDRNGEFYEADLGASWEIDVFGGLRRGKEAARAEFEASQAGVVAAQLTIVAQTADTYVTIRGLQSRIEIALQQLETQRQLLATVRLQYEAGVAAQLQMSQAEGALAQVEATIPVLETGLDSAMNALDVLLGAQPGTYRAELQIAEPVPLAPAIGDAGGPAGLIRRRPDLIIAERKLAASNALIGAAIAEYFPKLSLSGLIGSASTAGVFNAAALQAQGALGLRWRLFDFVRVDAEIAAARGQNAEALAAYRLSVLRASEDVEDAFSNLINREDEERLLANGEQSLTRAKVESLAAYKGGVVSLIEVLDADTRLLQTRDTRARAKTEASRAAIASFRALGGGWEPHDPAKS